MIYKYSLAVALTFSLSAIYTVQAGETCKEISYTGGGQLMLLDGNDCNTAINTLSQSQQFPEVFLSDPAKLLGVCYSSVGAIPAKIGNKNVNIKLTSTWTTEFNPAPPANDALGTVVTQWNVQDFSGKPRRIGYLYTHDTINLANSTELDVVISGDGKFAGVTGAVRINSTPDPTSFVNSLPGLLNIIDLTGTVCSDNWPNSENSDLD